MEGSSYGENVRPVRARTRDVKREERERMISRNGSNNLMSLMAVVKEKIGMIQSLGMEKR